jgi:hypothetical protein
MDSRTTEPRCWEHQHFKQSRSRFPSCGRNGTRFGAIVQAAWAHRHRPSSATVTS